ncbi:hypothetical protein Shyd_93550 [Streptomyces hydrogenans]|uniref:Uncharacterized protein n=1 Tax=Streptomyces hydrogenans TaxID=1873719 RepID=A0ABQ3PSK2_9ACTN|nr:hypothetical protein Shyd_93550 [Streptomyces hydrogenans]
MDRLVGPLREPQFADHLLHARVALGGRRVPGEAQLGRVREGAPDGQLEVQDVVLRDEPDALAQLGVVPVEVATVVEGPCPGRRAAAR